MTICKVNNLSFGYKKNKLVLNNCSFEINEGEIVGLLGENGAGKSTLFSCMTQSLKYQGDIIIDNVNIKNIKPKKLSKLISYLPQQSSISLSISVLDVILMGYNSSLSIFSSYKEEQIDYAINILKDLKIDDLVNEDFLNLSGGEKQLVLFARSIISNAKLMLLDEVSSGLDLKNKYDILNRLCIISKTLKQSVLISIHDPEAALMFCDRILVMSEGKIINQINPSNTSKEELKLTLSKIYGNINVGTICQDDKIYYSIIPNRS